MKFELGLLIILVMVSLGIGQEAAEISAISRKGTACLASQPESFLKIGQRLQEQDVIILDKGSQVRILFLESQRSKRYRAPQKINIAEELRKLAAEKQSPDRADKINDEICSFLSNYIKPQYNKYAGSRDLESYASHRIHDQIKSFLLNPHIIVRKSSPQLILLKSGTDDSPLPVKPATTHQDLMIFRTESALSYGTAYLWRIGDDSESGGLEIVPEQIAAQVRSTLESLKKEAIDENEYHEMVSAYLLKEGYWAEALIYVLAGLKSRPDNSRLQNLRASIEIVQPEDGAFQQAAANSRDLSLKYSFRLKRDNRFHEIIDGDTVRSGDRMQIEIQASQTCYLFILNIDSAQKPYVLFPLKIMDHLIPGGTVVTIPPQGRYFQANNRTGTEKLFIIASNTPLDFFAEELDHYFSRPASLRGEFKAAEKLLQRGFPEIADTVESTKGIAGSSVESAQSARVLQNKGYLIREIDFYHVD